jgi:AraC-like DNA-binding protein
MNNKIIVVEDEIVIANDIKNTLEKEGYEVITHIKTVEKAIASIEENKPILVLIDINLNQLKDGIDLGSYLLKEDTIPYIYITSHSNKATLDRAHDTRPHGYIVKPFSPESIIATVSIVINNYKYKNIDTLRSPTPSQEIIPRKIKSIVEYINNNINRKLDVEELTTLTKWTKRHLTRIFIQYLQQSPYQYILNKKTERSKSFLLETNMSINEIAFELGFKNVDSFSNAFKKINSESPENYRKKNRNIQKD